jgi:hypothetical protein
MAAASAERLAEGASPSEAGGKEDIASGRTKGAQPKIEVFLSIPSRASL